MSYLSAVAHARSHSHAVPALNPNATWFVALSILVKEWLFRMTRGAAKEENSSVLMANMFHHRTDAYSDPISLIAVMVGTSQHFHSTPSVVSSFPASSSCRRPPRDHHRVHLAADSLHAQGPAGHTVIVFACVVVPRNRLYPSAPGQVIDLRRLDGARASGPGLDVFALLQIEEAVAEALKGAQKDVKDVAVRFKEVDESRARMLPTQDDGQQ